MTVDQSKLAGEGCGYWAQYVRLNGYSFSPNTKGLRVLSRNLDISISHLSKCINAYLES